MKKMPFIIAGNWKMNPTNLKEAKKLFAVYKQLAKKYSNYRYYSYVPSLYLEPLARVARAGGMRLGAQNIYFQDSGSYTGAVSIPMVQDVGVESVLIGHSERRNLFGVSEEMIGKKITQAIGHNMPMTVCFGESIRDEQGDYTEELERQLETIMTPFVNSRKTKLLTLAYEPVWAIGAGAKRPVTEDELFSTLLLIKKIVATHIGENLTKQVPILYGGSVNAENAQQLSQVPGVGGFLIGRASLGKQSMDDISKYISQ